MARELKRRREATVEEEEKREGKKGTPSSARKGRTPRTPGKVNGGRKSQTKEMN